MKMMKKLLKINLPSVLFLISLSSCSTTLNFKYDPAPPKSIIKTPAYTVSAPTIKDTRPELNTPGHNARSIGKITANVSDMFSKELVLREDVSTVVTKAFQKELLLTGFKPAASGEADIVVSGDIKDFRLDIVSRDEVSIQIDLVFTQKSTGKVLWSGTASQKSSRFAGVFGNSSADISEYLTLSLSKAIRGALIEAAPYLNAETANHTPAQRDPGSGTGRLMIRTAPPGARLYVNGIYYGITPLTVTIDSGIIDMSLKLDGHRELKEKVSIRNSEITEADFKLEKE